MNTYDGKQFISSLGAEAFDENVPRNSNEGTLAKMLMRPSKLRT